MSRRFIFTLLTLIIIAVMAGVAVFLAKGYRFSTKDGNIILGTGILSVTSVPDQASVYLDGHLTSATNTNINSLPPKEYDVKIEKDGFIPWQKKMMVNEGLVTEIKATLFRSIPSVYPLTYNGVENLSLSEDEQQLIFVVPPTGNVLSDKKTGVWVWQMSQQPIAFTRGAEPHQIALSQSGIDYTKASFRWSPDSTQVLVTLPDRSLLLDTNRLNDPPRDVTAVVEPTVRGWDETENEKTIARLALIPDPVLRNTASSSAVLKWAPDESRFFYSKDGKTDFKVVSLLEGVKSTPGSSAVSLPTSIKQFDLPKADFYSWLPTSNHLVLVEKQVQATAAPQANNKDTNTSPLTPAKISIVEYDGFNKSEIYAGNFNPSAVYAWPDSSRLIIVSAVPTATGSKPNMFGVNLK